jgi:hypothetical protein
MVKRRYTISLVQHAQGSWLPVTPASLTERAANKPHRQPWTRGWRSRPTETVSVFLTILVRVDDLLPFQPPHDECVLHGVLLLISGRDEYELPIGFLFRGQDAVHDIGAGVNVGS